MTYNQPELRTEDVSEFNEVRVRLARIEELLQNLFGAFPALPDDAQRAAAARAAAHARGFFYVPEFAAALGVSKRWVSDNCSARVIKTLPGPKKPFRIPWSEERRWRTLSSDDL